MPSHWHLRQRQRYACQCIPRPLHESAADNLRSAVQTWQNQARRRRTIVFYWAPTSTIVAVPLAGADVPFVFPETTADFQSVTILGQLTYRVADPKRLASLLDLS
jgi:hypothetical protein